MKPDPIQNYAGGGSSPHNQPESGHGNHFPATLHEFTTSIFFPVGLALISVLTLLAIFLWRCASKQKKKEAQLAALTPINKSTHNKFAGVLANQPIDFVVPTITLSETSPYSLTEESMSDSDYLTTGFNSDREAGRSSPRPGRTRNSFHINPNELSKGMYEEFELISGQRRGQGKVTFVLHYSYYRQQLLVTILSASVTSSVTRKGPVGNLFAKVALLPDRTPKFLTKVHRNNLSPTFNELFIFPAKRAALSERILKISLRDKKCGQLGQALFPLKNAGIDTESITENPADVITDEIAVDLFGVREIEKQDSKYFYCLKRNVTCFCYGKSSCLLLLLFFCDARR